MFDISPALVAATQNINTFASNYGKQYRHWNGFDATMDVRLPKGITFTGGVTAGRTMTDNCEVIAKLPEVSVVAGAAVPVEFCHNETGLQPQYKMIGSYMLPVGGIRVSGNFQSLPGPGVQAGVIYTGAQLAPALGRVFSAGPNGQKTVNAFDANTTYSDRLNQLDLRFSKIFKIGRSSLDANFDVYNSFNSDAILALTTGYSGVNGGTWLRPTSIIQGRIIKLGMQVGLLTTVLSRTARTEAQSVTLDSSAPSAVQRHRSACARCLADRGWCGGRPGRRRRPIAWLAGDRAVQDSGCQSGSGRPEGAVASDPLSGRSVRRRVGLRNQPRLPESSWSATGATDTTGARRNAASTSCRSSRRISTVSISTSCTGDPVCPARCRWCCSTAGPDRSSSSRRSAICWSIRFGHGGRAG